MVTMASAPSNIANTTMSPDVSTSTLQKKPCENRRSNKPIMEKRRRARINNSLNELKTLLLDATKKDPARHSKLEKADILEMAVKYVGALQKSSSSSSSLTDKYMAGFSECATEVSRFPGIDPIVRRRLEQHLTNFVSSRGTRGSSVTNPTDLVAHVSQQNVQLHILPSDNVPTSNQTGILLSAGANSGVQLVPTRLPNGDIALILPSCSANNIQQRLPPVSPAPSSSSSSPPPLARIAHSRSASTDSESPIGFEHLSVNIPTSNSSIEDMMCHSPNSVHSNYSSPHSPDMSNISFNMKYENCRLYSPPLQKPLSLVVREGYVDGNDEKPWRPW